MITTEKRQAACVILRNNEKVLILRRSKKDVWMPGKWNLPGGRVDPGETPAEAGRRECEEECGISPKDIKLYRRIEKPTIVVWAYTATTDKDKVKLDHESEEHAWVNKDQIYNYDFTPGWQGMLRDFFELLPK